MLNLRFRTSILNNCNNEIEYHFKKFGGNCTA